ncbi:FecR family protein [Tellurirhabdus rosea]|uniref:FecR family protein n=1 Tax=Tellurirhabdus rosea TaxID=2674997 RepID=UPI00224CEDB1|nr:FecR family protein [Tellurirhabdus rosea]
MTRAAFEQLLERYSQGTCTSDEARRVETWFAQLASGSVQELDEAEREAIQARMLAHIRRRTESTTPVVPLRRLWQTRPFGWVAAFLLLGLSGLWLYLSQSGPDAAPGDAPLLSAQQNPPAVHRAQSNPRTVSLSDGSRVVLQPGSVLYISARFGRERREVELQGNAFFDIVRVPDRPFLVYCGPTITQVLGTRFWIRSQGKETPVEVAVRSGRVTVFENAKETSGVRSTPAYPKRNGVVLTPNQKVVFYPQQRQLVTGLVARPQLIIPPQQIPAFTFDATPLPEVFRTLEKGYGVEFMLAEEKLESCSFSGDLTGLSLEEKLKLICESVNAAYEVRGTHILVFGRGCR